MSTSVIKVLINLQSSSENLSKMYQSLGYGCNLMHVNDAWALLRSYKIVRKNQITSSIFLIPYSSPICANSANVLIFYCCFKLKIQWWKMVGKNCMVNGIGLTFMVFARRFWRVNDSLLDHQNFKRWFVSDYFMIPTVKPPLFWP